MLSLLLISPNKQDLEQYIQTLCQEQGISPFDLTQFQPETSIGIEDIRNLQPKLYLKPFKSTQKVIVIHHADTMTIEAQNALLKVLEEPPAHTIIILTASNSNHFLPTILSRCKIIELASTPTELALETQYQYTSILVNLDSQSIGDKLALAQEISKEKNHCIQWLKEAMISLREEMLKTEDRNLAQILLQLQEAYRLVTTTNINQRMVLEETFLNF